MLLTCYWLARYLSACLFGWLARSAGDVALSLGQPGIALALYRVSG